MAQMKYVKLNKKASIFYDQASGIKVVRNETVELTESQFKMKCIRNAIANGYLKEVVKEEAKQEAKVVESSTSQDTEEEVTTSIDENILKTKFSQLISEGSTKEKIKEYFNLKELKELAISLDIIPEDGDTKMDLISAIWDELVESK